MKKWLVVVCLVGLLTSVSYFAVDHGSLGGSNQTFEVAWPHGSNGD